MKFKEITPSQREKHMLFEILALIASIWLLLSIGCPNDIEFNVIHFAVDTEIATEDSGLLYENLQVIQDHPKIDIELNGYTDSVGEDSVNMVKSYARADTINAWLVRNGVDSLRLLVIGCGEDDPVGDNRTADGRALNNRVEFVSRNSALQ